MRMQAAPRARRGGFLRHVAGRLRHVGEGPAGRHHRGGEIDPSARQTASISPSTGRPSGVQVTLRPAIRAPR
ncbi:MAG: hypothetical protein U1E23_16885 [Reyranellaceae bacterium]